MTTKTGPILLAFTQLPRQKIMSDSGVPVILLFSPLRTEWLCVLVKKSVLSFYSSFFQSNHIFTQWVSGTTE